jgi:DedD protein
MEERGLRDIERWRDKIEVRLDNRQVFFLFFGSALVACMLFVLGVIVGKRLESRGRAVSPEIEDPLALLDKVATSPRPAQGAMTFPQTLFGTSHKTGTDKLSKKTTPATESAPEPVKAAPAKTEAAPAVEGKKAAKLASETDPKASKTEARAVAVVGDQRTKPETASREEPADLKPAPPRESKPAAIPTIGAGGDAKTKGHFTLQLSSFQDKAEAEAFAQKYASEKPYLVVSDIPGKGTWYRVRVGDYATSKDAIAAKESFEKKHNVIAYVAQR